MSFVFGEKECSLSALCTYLYYANFKQLASINRDIAFPNDLLKTTPLCSSITFTWVHIFPEGTPGGGGRRQRKFPAVIVPHPGPCLIDLWTGQLVARNAVVEDDPAASSGKSIKVRSGVTGHDMRLAAVPSTTLTFRLSFTLVFANLR